MLVAIAWNWIWLNLLNLLAIFQLLLGPGVVLLLTCLFGGYIYDLVVFPIDVWLGGAELTGWGIFASLFLLQSVQGLIMFVLFVGAEMLLYAIDDGARVEHNYYGDLDPTRLINAITNRIDEDKAIRWGTDEEVAATKKDTIIFYDTISKTTLQ